MSREVEPENDESIILKRQVRRHSPDCWGCWVHCWLLREVDSGDEARIPGLISHTDICVWSAATTAVVVSAVVFQPHGGLWRDHTEELGGREGMEGGWRGGNVSVFQAHTQQKAAAVPWERRPAGQPLFTDAEHASSCHLASQSLNTPPHPATVLSWLVSYYFFKHKDTRSKFPHGEK